MLLWVQFDSLFQSNNLFLADATYHSHSYCVCHQNSSLGFNCMLGVIEIPQFVPSIRQLVLYVILPPSVCATKGHLLLCVCAEGDRFRSEEGVVRGWLGKAASKHLRVQDKETQRANQSLLPQAISDEQPCLQGFKQWAYTCN